MKTFISVILSCFLLACQHNPASAQDQTLVGKLEGGEAILTIDKSKTIEIFTKNLLKLSDIDGKFTDMVIKVTTDKQYFLVFKGETYASSFIINAVNSDLFAVNTIACSTSACAEEAFGCTPRSNKVACWPCSNKGKCTKTVSSFSLIDE